MRPFHASPTGLLCALVTPSNSHHSVFALSLLSDVLPGCCVGPCLASFRIRSNVPFPKVFLDQNVKMSTFHSGHAPPLFWAHVHVCTSKRAGVQACSHPWDVFSVMTSWIYLLVDCLCPHLWDVSFIRTGSAPFIHSLSLKPRAEPRPELALCQSWLSERMCPGWDGIWQLRGGCARGRRLAG